VSVCVGGRERERERERAHRTVITQEGAVVKPVAARTEMYAMLIQDSRVVNHELRMCTMWLGMKCAKKKLGKLKAKEVDPDGPCAQAGIVVNQRNLIFP